MDKIPGDLLLLYGFLFAAAAGIILIVLMTRSSKGWLRLPLGSRSAVNDHIFGIVSAHTERILCYYDIRKDTVRPWHTDSCQHCALTHMCLRKYSLRQFESGEYVLPESRKEAARMVREIREGIPFGQATLLLQMEDGRSRWFEFKYSGLSDQGKPGRLTVKY